MTATTRFNLDPATMTETQCLIVVQSLNNNDYRPAPHTVATYIRESQELINALRDKLDAMERLVLKP